MESKILDGKGLAQITEQEIKSKVSELKKKGITPTLATVLVGVDPASATYVKMKQNACSRLGMESIAIELSKDTTTDELLKTIQQLNENATSVFTIQKLMRHKNIATTQLYVNVTDTQMSQDQQLKGDSQSY